MLICLSMGSLWTLPTPRPHVLTTLRVARPASNCYYIIGGVLGCLSRGGDHREYRFEEDVNRVFCAIIKPSSISTTLEIQSDTYVSSRHLRLSGRSRATFDKVHFIEIGILKTNICFASHSIVRDTLRSNFRTVPKLPRKPVLFRKSGMDQGERGAQDN